MVRFASRFAASIHLRDDDREVGGDPTGGFSPHLHPLRGGLLIVSDLEPLYQSVFSSESHHKRVYFLNFHIDTGQTSP